MKIIIDVKEGLSKAGVVDYIKAIFIDDELISPISFKED